jgi:hypothetical protein
MQFPMATVKKNALYICGVLRYLVVSAFVVHRAVEREIFLLHRTNHYILEPFFNTPLIAGRAIEGGGGMEMMTEKLSAVTGIRTRNLCRESRRSFPLGHRPPDYCS